MLKPYARRAATTIATISGGLRRAEPLLLRAGGRHEARRHGGDEEAAIQAAFGSYANGS